VITKSLQSMVKESGAKFSLRAMGERAGLWIESQEEGLRWEGNLGVPGGIFRKRGGQQSRMKELTGTAYPIEGETSPDFTIFAGGERVTALRVS